MAPPSSLKNPAFIVNNFMLDFDKSFKQIIHDIDRSGKKSSIIFWGLKLDNSCNN
jgi:hypothetical protein